MSPVIRRTCPTSTSNHSAMSWAKLVSWPWPAESVPMTTSIRPSGRTVISARSRGMPVFSSMSSGRPAARYGVVGEVWLNTARPRMQDTGTSYTLVATATPLASGMNDTA